MSAASQFFGGSGIPEIPSTDYKVVEFLLIGGGGGAGAFHPIPVMAGGAGEMIEGYNFVVKNGTTYPIVIGSGGGPGGPRSPAQGAIGGSSSFGYINAWGGAGGSHPTINGNSSGKGSQSAGVDYNPTSTSPTNMIFNFGDVVTVINSYSSPSSVYTSGGAGGSDAGRSNSITGTPVSYARGHRSGESATSGEAGSGAPGIHPGIPFTPPAPNIGSNGICVIRYPTAYPAASSVSGNTPTPAQPGYHVYRWNGSGSITF